MRRCSKQFVAAVALGCALSAAALASSTNDRDYQMGDDDGGASPGGLVGTTVDSEVPEVGAQQNLISIFGQPKYANVGPSGLARPGAPPGELGIQFNAATMDYLQGDRLGLPETSAAGNDGLIFGPLDYSGISNRYFQLWVFPTVAASAERQDIVMDTLQHGLGITMSGNWFMQYAGTVFDTGVAVATDQWHHVMVARPFGPTGPNSGARMWLDNGVAVGAASSGYDGDDNFFLVIGANTGDDFDTLVGESNFFTGTLDDLKMAVMGTSTTLQTDYGTFDVGEDNDFMAGQLTGVAGDVNQDTVFNQLDKDAFIAGWLSVNLVNGVPAGDLTTIGDGDLNFDGSTDLYDLVIMQDALAAAGMAAISGDDLTGSVPEPSTLVLVVLGLSGLPFLRRRRCD